jgi:hypothetical protein
MRDVSNPAREGAAVTWPAVDDGDGATGGPEAAPRAMSSKGLFDSWAAYAEAHGLLEDVPTPRRENKYGAKKITEDGWTFASKREAGRYQELKWRLKAGEIAELELQPVFPLHIMALWRSGPIQIETVGVFTADFRYVELTQANRGEIVVEDVKSGPTKTEAYRLRKRIAEAVHGVVITEIQ